MVRFNARQKHENTFLLTKLLYKLEKLRKTSFFKLKPFRNPQKSSAERNSKEIYVFLIKNFFSICCLFKSNTIDIDLTKCSLYGTGLLKKIRNKTK